MILIGLGCAMIGAALKGWVDGSAGSTIKYMLMYKIKETTK